MQEFLDKNTPKIIERFITFRTDSGNKCDEFEHVEVHLFINLVIRALKDDSQSNDKKVHEGFQAIERVAEAHGRHLVTLNFPPSEVAHYYGAICQSVMGIAAEESCCFPAKEYEIFNQCLDHGIAGAICGLQDGAIQEHAPDTEYAEFLHEIRNLISTATLALAAVKKGQVGLQGATGLVLDRSLQAMTNIVTTSVSKVKLSHTIVADEKFSLMKFVEDFSQTALLISMEKKRKFSFQNTKTDCVINIGKEPLSLALLNIVQNAFKFTKPHTEVTLSVGVNEDEAVISVADCCGGIPTDKVDKIFAPFVQENIDKSGLGLGLSIARRTIEEAGGRIEVINRPGIGCIFTITLPVSK